MNNFWNDRYAAEEFAYGTSPNKFFAEQLRLHQPTGRALMAAEGEGRNAVYAASSGWKVDAFDLSSEGRKKAILLAESAGVSINYAIGDFRDLGYQAGQYDLLALIYAHFPAELKKSFNGTLASYIKPGGLIIFEAFGSRHLPLRTANPQVGGPGAKDMLFSVEEVEATFPDFEPLYLKEEVVELNEGIYHRGKGSVVRFVGRKR